MSRGLPAPLQSGHVDIADPEVHAVHMIWMTPSPAQGPHAYVPPWGWSRVPLPPHKLHADQPRDPDPPQVGHGPYTVPAPAQVEQAVTGLLIWLGGSAG